MPQENSKLTIPHYAQGNYRSSRPGNVSSPVELAKGQSELPAESAGKYAEEAGRNAHAVGDQSGERPSDGRELAILYAPRHENGGWGIQRSNKAFQMFVSGDSNGGGE